MTKNYIGDSIFKKNTFHNLIFRDLTNKYVSVGKYCIGLVHFT
jgi:hypothetical protein